MAKNIMDRFGNKLVRGNVVTFSSPGAHKDVLGKKFKITNVVGDDIELIESGSKRRSFTSAFNVTRVR